MTQKILIGCPTYDGQEFCLEEFIRGLKKITHSHFKVLFVDNTEGQDYVKKLKSQNWDGLDYEIIHDSHKDTRISNIISSRNVVRNYFLKNDFSHLLFLDTDIIPPANVVEQLLMCESDIASGAYLCRVLIQGTYYIIPTLYLAHSDGTVKTMRRQDVTPSIFDIAVSGMGCCLISRNALEAIQFRAFSDSTSGGEDVAFCYDAKKCGFSLKANGACKCLHLSKNETLSF